jgi:hypothetical protein
VGKVCEWASEKPLSHDMEDIDAQLIMLKFPYPVD